MDDATPLIPVAFDPIFLPKPWGGRRLATLLGKALPPGEPIGESWELASLPEGESRVRGPAPPEATEAAAALAGRTLAELVQTWGRDLLGDVSYIDGRFPLLIKFLDARENLSIQVHPKPRADDPDGVAPGLKHECWYVLHADVSARLFIGLRPGVGPDDVRRAAGTRAMADLLEEWTPRPGELYMLPSGTPHALGAGVVVAEIQTPSDVTYRLYDWERVDAAGRPRAMHVDVALANVRYDVTGDDIRPPATAVGSARVLVTELADTPGFRVTHCQPLDDAPLKVRSGEMRVWILTHGSFTLAGPQGEARYARGDTLLIPAAARDLRLERVTSAEWLEVTAR